VIVSQLTLLDTLHAHPAGVVTLKDPFPPPPATVASYGLNVTLHSTAAAACVIVTLVPAMTSSVCRALVPELAFTA
jgi:hypothetical protein